MAVGDSRLGTPERLRDPGYTPSLATAIALGIARRPGHQRRVLRSSGLLPAAFIARVLNPLLPEERTGGQASATSAALAGDDRQS